MSASPTDTQPFPGAEKNSITHHHMFGVLATQVMRRAPPAGSTVRILDVGCGSGQLLAFLQSALERRFPSLSFELHGLDVTDSRVQKEDYFAATLGLLGASHPAIDWRDRLTLLSSTESWPHPANSFDFVVSNQVLEHVRDHDRLLADVARVLKADGLSVHLFPLGNAWIEWHLKMPFAHWLTNADMLYAWIKACSWLGLGTWRRYCREVAPVPLDEFARMNRDFVALETNYLVERDIGRLAKAHALKYAFRYTDDLYFNRARLALGLPLTYAFPRRSQFWSRVRMVLFRRISTITLVFEKDNRYENRGFHTPGN